MKKTDDYPDNTATDLALNKKTMKSNLCPLSLMFYFIQAQFMTM